MNFLGIDYGTKRIGLAVSASGFIEPISGIPNDDKAIERIGRIVDNYQIDKIFIGLSYGSVAGQTLVFVDKLRNVLKLPIQTVEEAVSTIEAGHIYRENRKKRKDYKKDIDSIAAAVILRRIVS